MIISYEHNYIFIKTHKTAGSSMSVVLGRMAGPDDVVTPVWPWESEMATVVSPPFIPKNYVGWEGHDPARKVVQKIGQAKWDSMFKFCFERNPWAKVVSWYLFRRANGKCKNPDFNKWVIDRYASDYRVPAFPADRSLYMLHGNVAMDYIGKYETLQYDFGLICEHLNLPFNGVWPVLKKNRSYNYKTFYTPLTRGLIAEVFCEEIEMFGYEY